MRLCCCPSALMGCERAHPVRRDAATAPKSPIDKAIAHWGPDRRLQGIPVFCSMCGTRNVDIRVSGEAGHGGMPKVWGGPDVVR